MIYILMLITAVFMTGQNVVKQKYNNKCTKGTYLFSGMIAFWALGFFLVCNRDWNYSLKLLLPSFAFAVVYAMATVFAVLAIKHGSLTITTLIISYSLLIPTFYGIIFLKEPVGAFLIIGIILLAISLWLTNYKKDDQKHKVTVKWIVYVALAFVGNGMCSTVQKWEQLTYGEQGQNMFMIVALAMTVVIFVVCAALTGEKKDLPEATRKGWRLAMICGIMNGAVNYLVMYMNRKVSASVMFPVLSGASLVMIFVYSLIIEREKFTPKQCVGFAVGVVSVVLLNI